MGASRLAAAVAASVAAALLAGCSGSGTDPAPVAERAAAAVERASGIDGWPTASPASLGLRPGVLRAGAREARSYDSTCFAVTRRGRLAQDWSWGIRRTVPREVFSITKSVTSALVGIAVRDGALRLDDRVSRYVPEWRGTASESVTVRNLLSNDSGRFWSMQSDYRDLLQARDRTAYAVSLPQQYPPGTAWQYNNAAIQVLEPVLERATGVPVARFARERLFEPLGMSHSTFITDKADSAAVFYGLRTTCLDLARFGMLYLGHGKAYGTRLLSRSYVRASVGRSSTEHNAAYGYLWWLNRYGRLRGATDPVDAQGQPLTPRTGSLAPDSPAYLYAALGFGGQVLMVDPRSRTIVVRLGLPAPAGEEGYEFPRAARVITRATR
jgi:CubicO group peptidase (beta-lactamase class C family)